MNISKQDFVDLLRRQWLTVFSSVPSVATLDYHVIKKEVTDAKINSDDEELNQDYSG